MTVQKRALGGVSKRRAHHQHGLIWAVLHATAHRLKNRANRKDEMTCEQLCLLSGSWASGKSVKYALANQIKAVQGAHRNAQATQALYTHLVRFNIYSNVHYIFHGIHILVNKACLDNSYLSMGPMPLAPRTMQSTSRALASVQISVIGSPRITVPSTFNCRHTKKRWNEE